MPHEGHISNEDVPELRKLVEVMVAQEESDLCQAGVVRALQQLRSHCLSVGVHGPELVNHERFAVQSDSFLFINGRSVVFLLDFEVAPKHEWREDYEANASNQGVLHSLYNVLQLLCGRPMR